MEIDPKKMDFNEMKSGENLEGEMNTSQAESVNDANNGAKYNPESSASTLNSDQLFVSLKKPTELLSEAWEIYKIRWKTLLGILIVPLLLIFITFLIFGIGGLTIGLLKSFISGSSVAGIIIYFVGFILILVLFLAMITVQFWSQIALIYAIKDSEEGIGIKESYRRGWCKIKPFIWVSVLSSLIIFSGFILFYIPGIIFSIWFSFAVFIVVAEDLKGMDAILKSREYIRNYWWQVFWRGLFLAVVMVGVIVVVFIFSILIKLVSSFLIGELAIKDVLNLIINFASVTIVPFITIYSFLIYDNLRKIKGDFEFKPSAKAKKSFVALVVLGILPAVLVIGGIISTFSIIFSSLNISKSGTPAPIYNTYEDSMNGPEKTFEDTIESRDKQRILDLSFISQMLERYKTKNGVYPMSYNSVKLNRSNQIIDEIELANKNASIPIDPKYPEYYYSYKSSDGKSFELSARLENPDDPNCDLKIKKENGICIYKLRH